MDNRRLLLAVILSMAVLFGWSYFFAPEPPPADEVATVGGGPDQPAQQESPGVTELPSQSPPASAEPTAVEAASGAAVEELPRIEAATQERTTITTETAEIELSNRGGQIVAYRLLDYRQSKDGELMNLIRQRDGELFPFGLTGPDGRALPLNDALFTLDRPSEKELVYRYRGPLGSAEKRFVFNGAGAFDVTVKVEGGDFGVFLGPGVRNPPESETGNRFFRRRVVYMSGSEFETLASTKVRQTESIPSGALRWIALDDTYFLTAVLPDSAVQQVAIDPVMIDPVTDGGQGALERVLPGAQVPDERKKEARELAVRLMPAGDELTAHAYFGPKDYDRLSSFEVGLERTVALGWFRPIARVFMIGMQWIYDNVVSNWGWAIVLMTLLIKIALLPITWKHAASMRKMQQLNPKIQAVRQRYAGKLKDKNGRPNLEVQRKMNEEVMGTYREAGVNPAGGCLPMLLQIPVFFAFYKLLYEAVELRHAPWMFWITDLSAKDPFYILPIVMGASQLIQQRLMPTPAGNPLQRRMMAMMPVVFTFFFLGFPAGLVLYWLTNNVTSVIQQVVYNRLHQSEPEAVPAKSGGGKSGGRKKAAKAR